MLAKLTRWYTPAEALTWRPRTNAELLALSGPRNPYPGKLGVVEEGALADLLLVDGNPLENLACRRPGEELRGHHEGRQDLQEQARALMRAGQVRAREIQSLLVALVRNRLSWSRAFCDLGERRRPRGACHNLRPVTIGGVTSERLQNQKEFFC